MTVCAKSTREKKEAKKRSKIRERGDSRIRFLLKKGTPSAWYLESRQKITVRERERERERERGTNGERQL